MVSGHIAKPQSHNLCEVHITGRAAKRPMKLATSLAPLRLDILERLLEQSESHVGITTTLFRDHAPNPDKAYDPEPDAISLASAEGLWLERVNEVIENQLQDVWRYSLPKWEAAKCSEYVTRPPTVTYPDTVECGNDAAYISFDRAQGATRFTCISCTPIAPPLADRFVLIAPKHKQPGRNLMELHEALLYCARKGIVLRFGAAELTEGIEIRAIRVDADNRYQVSRTFPGREYMIAPDEALLLTLNAFSQHDRAEYRQRQLKARLDNVKAQAPIVPGTVIKEEASGVHDYGQ